MGFQKIFEEYGADYQATMERFMNNEGMYLRLLDMLFQDDNLAKLGSALEAGELDRAFEAGHTLKGVTGNMGLEPLFRVLGELVEPLRAGEKREDYLAMYERVQAEFKRVEAFRDKLKGAEGL